MRIDKRQFPQLPLRIAVGGALAYHGAPFLFTRGGHADLVYMLTQVGLPAPTAIAWFVALLEFAGGLALIVGFATDIAAVLLVIELATRISVIGLLRGGIFPTPLPDQPALPGYELTFQYLAGLIALLIAGPGLYSIDRRRAQSDQAQG